MNQNRPFKHLTDIELVKLCKENQSACTSLMALVEARNKETAQLVKELQIRGAGKGKVLDFPAQ